MSFMLLAILVTVSQSQSVESFSLVELVSDYAKVFKNSENPAVENVSATAVETPPDNPSYEYEDFDEVPEDERSINQRPSGDSIMTFVKGFISLLTLLYKFNGSFDTSNNKPQRIYRNPGNEPRRKRQLEDTERRFHEAQDRFEFPQKKFRYQGTSSGNMVDQQFQPVENYPPYNPLKANTAETYSNEDKKTSYDADLAQYDKGKTEVDVQQSYSYEIPYETAKPVKQSNDWNSHQVHPVYQPWMSSTGDASSDDSYQPWSSMDDAGEGDSYSYSDSLMTNQDSYNPWKSKPAADTKPDLYQPWKSKPIPEEPKPDSYQPWKSKPIPEEPKPDSYQPWKSKPIPEEPKPDSYQPWKSKPIPEEPKPESYHPWKSKPIADEPKPTNGNTEPRQPWTTEISHYPVYHHPGPDDHHFEFHDVDQPEVDEDRMTKKPYSYYFLGRKLWYIPLLFSVYFIIYIGALVLKSVAKHKIQFPEKVWNLHDDHFGHAKTRRHRKIDEVTEKYEKSVEKLNNKFM